MKGTTQRNRLILEVLVVLSVVLMLVRPVTGDSYRRFATDTLHYVRATVEEVIAQELTDSPLHTGQKLGSQRLLVRLSAVQEVDLDNYLTGRPTTPSTTTTAFCPWRGSSGCLPCCSLPWAGVRGWTPACPSSLPCCSSSG